MRLTAEESVPVGQRHRLDVGDEIDAGGVDDAVETAKSVRRNRRRRRNRGADRRHRRRRISERHRPRRLGNAARAAASRSSAATRAPSARRRTTRREADPLGGAGDQDAASCKRAAHRLAAARGLSRTGRMSSTISSQRPIQTFERASGRARSGPPAPSCRDGWPMICGMHADHHHAVLGVEHVELARPRLEHCGGRLHGAAGQHDRILEEGRIIEHPAERQFDDLRLCGPRPSWR